jgi:hypothetical protein
MLRAFTRHSLRGRLRRQVLYVLASVWRRALFRTTFIAVTGSLGKTTAKECIAGILQTRFRTAKTPFLRPGRRRPLPESDVFRDDRL